MTTGTCSASAADARELFANEAGDYRQRTPRQLPSQYLYDELGSSLFEAICRLPWYHVTRAASRLLATYAREILAPLDRPLSLAELGCGSGDKLATWSSRSVMTQHTTDSSVLNKIQSLAHEEERLYGHAQLSDHDHVRLETIRVELDQCWDLLRQRRARREFGQDPDTASVRPTSVIDSYQR